ncbi:LAFE_0E09274g1_1 [Lachancea fermentati]|uniref:LAFE_0E09274g1_1 n=1 Tax=Lachancea fermentati TaxID=4955 RepID=A0A1G4MDR7_LACFM|nr:LAFE_0E09274g1_1 [Lachancea fermentati]
MSEEDDKRAKQLEEARKRVEELKNKRKKKDKKKKSSGKVTETTETEDITNENDVAAGSAESGEAQTTSPTPALEDTSSPSSEVLNQSPTRDDNADEVIPKDAVETVKESEESVNRESDELTTTESMNSAVLSASAPVIDEVDAVTAPETSDSVKSANKSMPDVSAEDSSHDIDKHDEVRIDTQNTDVHLHNSRKDDNGADELFTSDNQEPDFLTTLKEEKEQSIVKDLQEQVDNLNALVKKLKFLNMEQETTIEELQEKVHELEQKCKNSENELSITKEQLAKNSSVQNLYSGNREASSSTHFNRLTPQPPISNSPQGHLDATPFFQSAIDRSLINKWSGWNLDMTQWRSIGSGEIVNF